MRSLAFVLSCLLCIPAAVAGQRVDPAAMERTQAVANAGPPEAAIAGSWDVWISGAVLYASDGRNLYQHYQPGAAMNRLEIDRDGGYRWGSRRGRLEEVRPWHHQADRRYYRLRHPSGNEYEFYRSADDRLVVLFGGVGGHAATGTRLGGGNDRSVTAPGAPVPAPDRAPERDAVRGPDPGPDRPSGHAVGGRVDVQWSGGWYKAQILQQQAGRYLVRYDGYGSTWDEWVEPARIRPLRADGRGAGRRD